MADFEDIRPYHDHEVRGVLDRLLSGLDLSRALAKFRYPRLYRLLPGIMARLVRMGLRRELQGVNDIASMQAVIEKYLNKLIETTTTSLTHAGLEHLDSSTSYLFISNHRDITMDPALVNYMLYHQHYDTLQIAIGDNLLKKPFIADLMRLNKSFIVKRGLHGREILKASKQLSAYIHHCVESGQNVWIAQREGRAKDGNDRTEPAVIKMLHMAEKDREQPRTLGQSFNSLGVVPVAISYEYDPCDVAKAEELHAIDTTGAFHKTEESDVQSILHGMIGNKGDVHVAFGSLLKVADDATADHIVQAIDRQVRANYRLHLSNYLALEKVQPGAMDFQQLFQRMGVSEEVVNRKRAEFEARLASCPEHLRPYLLRMYANPVLAQLNQPL